MRRLLLFFGFMMLGMGLLYGMARWIVPDRPVNEVTVSEELVEGATRIVGLHIDKENADGQRWSLEAERGLQQGGRTSLVRVNFQLHKGENSETIGRSGAAVWHKERGQLFFSDGVRLDRFSSHWSVESDTMFYNINQGVVYSEDTVLIEYNQWVQKSQGFKFFLEEGRIEMDKPVLYSR